MRADRLLTLLLLLQNEGKQTSRALAERLEVSERTIMRDMEALSAAGVPVYAERGSGGGWRLMPDYRTNLTGMKPDELLALLIATHPRLLADLDIRRHYDAAFHKLLASSPLAIRRDAERLREKIHIDGAGWHQTVETCPCLPIVQEAVVGERKLAMLYNREQTVSPLGLVAKGTVWYMVADTDDGIRTYRIARIREATVLDEAIVRPAEFDLAAYWEQSTASFMEQLPLYPARLAMTADTLARLRQIRFVRIIRTTAHDSGGSSGVGGSGDVRGSGSVGGSSGSGSSDVSGERLEADIAFNTLESACGILLGFSASIEVLSPTELKLKLAGEAAAIVRLYGD